MDVTGSKRVLTSNFRTPLFEDIVVAAADISKVSIDWVLRLKDEQGRRLLMHISSKGVWRMRDALKKSRGK